MKQYYLTKQNLKVTNEQQHTLVLLQWIMQAEQRLWEREPQVAVSAHARRKLSVILFQRLSYLADATMKALLRDRLIALNPIAAWDMRLASQAENERASRELLEEWEQADGEPLFTRAPLLRDALSACVCRFIDFVLEIFSRVALQRQELLVQLFHGVDFGEITELSCDAADLHFHGRSTVMLQTQHGSFFYKPRDCRIDVLLRELSEKWFPNRICFPKTILGEGYAFCEAIEAVPVKSAQELEQYYENLGGLYAFCRALGSNDLHSENLVAHGVFPVVVDLETMLAPVARVFNNPEVFPNVQNPEPNYINDLNASLLASSLLPALLNGEERSVLLDEKRRNLPVLDGVKYSVRMGYEDAFFKGFSCTYDRCIELRETLLQALEPFRDITIRFLVRNTDYYAQVQRRMLQPAALASEEAQKSVTLGMRDFFLRHGVPAMVAIAAWEEACMMEGDIPYFCARGDGEALRGYTCEVIPNFFLRSAVENAQSRIRDLSEVEKQFELSLLRTSLDCAIVPLPQEKIRRLPEEMPDAPLLTDHQILAEAESLMQRICAHALKGPCGQSFWMEHVGSDARFSPMKPVLAQGSLGLGLFLAAAGAVTQNSEMRKQAKSFASVCVHQVQQDIETYALARIIPQELCTAGLSDGFAGMLHALVLMGRYLEDSTVTELAQKLLSLVRPAEIAAFTQTDVLSGVAGLLMVLCRCEELRETEQGRACMEGCANKLLAAKTLSMPNGKMLWDTLALGRPISGLGHGMAGIAVALMQAGAILGREDCIVAASDALSFEHEIYMPSIGTWPDLRDSAYSKRAMHGFCSGAPGIGIALLACKRSGLAPEFVEEDIQRAFAAVEAYPLSFRDHLCCGNSGVVDFLLEADKHDMARQRLSQMVARKQLYGDFSYLPPDYEPIFSTSLFYGAAGVGYELLRLLNPTKIQSILV